MSSKKKEISLKKEIFSAKLADSKWAKRKEYLKEHPIANFFDILWCKIYYRFPSIMGDRCRDVKHGFQRMFRGYDDTAYWGLNAYITDIALPVLKCYRKNKHGVPMLDGFEGNNDFKAMTKEWNSMLDKMIHAFELIQKDEMGLLQGKYDTKKAEKEWKETKEGLQLFADHFTALWD